MSKREARKIVKDAVSAGRRFLLEPEGKNLISAWGIDVPKSISGQWPVVGGRRDIEDAVRKLTPPFVLKVISPDILHKSDVGGVVPGLKDAVEVNNAFAIVIKNLKKKAPTAGIDGFLLEEMAPKGAEVIIGGLKDPQFGPAVMFGTGGFAVELLKDVSFRLAPVNREDALDMVKEVKGYPLLTGYRGLRPVDMGGLADAIVRVSSIITELEDIKEIEINPLIAHEKGVTAVDARVILDGPVKRRHSKKLKVQGAKKLTPLNPPLI